MKIILKKLRIPIFTLETLILLLMLITLFIKSDLTSILPWSEISPFILIRAIIWIFGLSIFPGMYLIRLSKILEKQSTITKIVIGVNLSFALVGLATLFFYYINILSFLPFFLLGILTISGLVYWLNNKFKLLLIEFKNSKWILLLIIIIIINIIIAFFIQEAQRYLISGDNWVGLLPAIQIINQRNVYSSFYEFKYPLMFGFVLTGLSICSGLPVVNTYVALFPLVALNILTFFILLRTLFNFEEKSSVMASMIYSLTGGLGWIIQTLFYKGSLNFWKLSDLTQDMYFGTLWNSIQFSYKSLALTFAYTSVITFIFSIRFKSILRKLIMLVITSFLILFSFFIHMLEPIIFLPIIFIIAFLYEDRYEFYLTSIFFFLITSFIFIIIDFLMSGYFYSLIIHKINVVLLPRINFADSTLFIMGLIILISFYIYRIHLSNYLKKNNSFHKLKALIIMTLIIIYFSGLYFWIKSPKNISVYQLMPCPWYYYTTRYGLIGLLALIGIGFAKWRTKWFKIASLWFLFSFIAGNIWWSRMTIYFTPMVALFASIGLNGIWEIAHKNIKIDITGKSSNQIERSFKFNPKPIIATLMMSMIFISTSSLFYMASYYISTGPSLSDNEAKALLWINQNTPQNSTILVPNIYKIYKTVKTISDREIYISNFFPSINHNIIKIIGNYGIRYVFVVNDEISASLRLLLQYSTIEFELGDIKIFSLPDFKPPSSKDYSIAVVDKEILGFLGNSENIGWIDDDFKDGWVYRNVNVSSNGELLNFSWDLKKLYESEPHAFRKIIPVDTGRYPYLVIKYRNTVECEKVTQIITLINETSYPQGFIKNLYLPLSKEKDFNIFIGKLPKNQTVAKINIWMRNDKNLNGTTHLQIDYIGFTSLETIQDKQCQLKFLQTALPALWPDNYSISSNIYTQASIVITIFDKTIPTYIGGIYKAHTFVFLNLTAGFPSWGNGWRNIEPGITSGHIYGKKVFVIGIGSFENNEIVKLAERIYEYIYSDK